MNPIHPLAVRQRGLTLLEALVALVLSAAGLMALAGVQAQIHQAVAGSRHLSQAAHALQRAVTRAAHPGGAEAAAETPEGLQLSLSVQELSDPLLGPAVVGEAHWLDARGLTHRLQLAQLTPPQDAHLAALHHLPLPPAPISTPPGWGPSGREVDAQRVLIQPVAAQPTAWVVARDSGAVLSRCQLLQPLDGAEPLPANALQLCTDAPAEQRWPLSGHLRFSAAAQQRVLAQAPTLASLGVELRLSDGTARACPTGALGSQAAGELHYRYHCLVPDGTWSGRTVLTGLSWGIEGFRVCRYSQDLNANGRIDPFEHPAEYSGVVGGLSHQNFLLVLGDETCPTGASGATQTHQP